MEKTLHYTELLRQFAGLEQRTVLLPDQTTRRFWHLLKKHQPAVYKLARVNIRPLQQFVRQQKKVKNLMMPEVGVTVTKKPHSLNKKTIYFKSGFTSNWSVINFS